MEDLCAHGKAETVYALLRDLVEDHVISAVQPFLGEAMDKLYFMKKMNTYWSGHCQR